MPRPVLEESAYLALGAYNFRRFRIGSLREDALEGLKVGEAMDGVGLEVAAFGPFVPGVEGENIAAARVGLQEGLGALERLLEGLRRGFGEYRRVGIAEVLVGLALLGARRGGPTRNS